MYEKILQLIREIATIEFWENCFNSFRILGPIMPMLLAAVESLVPALPLIAIVTLNVGAHGPLLGFLYSWIGACVGSTLVFLFFRRLLKRILLKFIDRHPRVKKARDWVNGIHTRALFFIAILPFTPSSFLNFAFGVSDFDERKYLITMVSAKAIMIMLLAVFGQSLVQAMQNPLFIILAAALAAALYFLSKKVSHIHHLK